MRSRLSSIAFVLATALMSASCASQVWDGTFILVGITPLTAAESATTCARIKLRNESLTGELKGNFFKGSAEASGFDSDDYATWTKIEVYSEIFDATHGRTYVPYSSDESTVPGPFEYGSTATFEVPFDTSLPALAEATFDLEVTAKVRGRTSADSELELGQYVDLGFDNKRSIPAGSITAQEGLCGFEYRYLVRSGYTDYPTPRADF